MEALILPKAIQLRIDRSLSGPSPAKLCDIGMVDLIFGERRGKNVEIVLRVGAGPWDRAHIDELSDLRGASHLDRKSAVLGQRGCVRVALGGRRIITQKKQHTTDW